MEPPSGYLAQAREVCAEAGTLLIVDEIQTGLGRTGKLFACDHEEVAPDVLTLAKALGGGLMPIGACLCREEVYNEEFALRHSSTFAGNTLACEAGLATLALLQRDDQLLVRQVAARGARLKQELLALQRQHADVVASVRGRGLMLGVELNLRSSREPPGLLGYLAEQELLGYLITSYLLNVEKIRVAPTMSAGDVLRIEPPLVVGWSECEAFLAAFDRTLTVLESGNTGRLLAHLIGADVGERPPAPRPTGRRYAARPRAGHPAGSANDSDGRFAFLVHLNDTRDYVDLDPSLEAFREGEITQLRARLADLLEPSPVHAVFIESPTGRRAGGELIMVPYTAKELIELPYGRALGEIVFAVELAQRRGARIVGLGGFTSILTQGGLALRAGLAALTTGNSYTVVAAKKAVESACQRRSLALSTATAAVIGAAGAVGRATAMLLAENVACLILVGNPRHPERSRRHLLEVAASILRRLWELPAATRPTFAPGTLADRFLSMRARMPPNPSQADFIGFAEDLGRSGTLTVTTDVGRFLPEADVVLTAASTVEGVVPPEALKRGAIVCEVSRPLMVSGEARNSRPDILFVEGGLVRIPGEPDLGFDFGHGKGIAFACMAETMLLALEQRYQDASLGVRLDLETIHDLEVLGERHGFAVVIEHGRAGCAPPGTAGKDQG